tara:strand:- start:46 stop:3063 length:3018 start_codon:yes stop_codon:yes gene_type:complete
MALFQKSVLANHLNSITEKEILSGWEKFQNYKSISENIRTYKEEEFQYKFLEMLFVDCLGYKISDVGDEKRNLYTEVKNVSDSKKADGAIKKDDEVIAVIELKSTKTKDFKKIQEQAFGYKVNQPKCKYVITSNFEKLRFYINDATEFEEFDLFNLTQHDFKLLHVCLHINNIFNDIPEKLKTDSVFEEENITKKLYKDYSAFRKEVFNSLVENNTEYDKLLLFNKTQKLLDRFLFIFFAEDRNLLPVNSISEIIKVWENDRSFYGQRSLYEVYKGYFKVLNNGRPPSEGRESIFAYNGGLFAEDEVLNSIKIDDEILLRHTKNLSHYDFESDVSVNILGHIFEHSLTEIEEIQNEISGLETGTSKRKKDGVFYTPQYITKYIVENTLGKLCKEKKIELDINEETYAPSTKRSRERIQILENYRNWLLGLTICDPACGSGAFLNQALSFLIDEHKYIDELSALYNKDSLMLSDVKNSILENNLFGVDINEESVEIAKLSLWLRTAEKGRKLTSLNNNLKCGNSLIDDLEVAGNKAFSWEKGFPEVFAKGGFDVVIGNPPYVDMRSMLTADIKFFKKKYNTASNRLNLFGLFVEKSYNIMNNSSEYGMIIHRNLIRSNEYEKCRDLILNKTELNSILSFKNGVFDAVTGEMTTLTFSKKSIVNLKNEVAIYNFDKKIDNTITPSYINQDVFNNCIGKRFNVYLTKSKAKILNKRFKDSVPLGEISFTLQGIIAGDEKKYVSKIKLNDSYEPILRGRDIDRYMSEKPYEFIYYVEGTKVLTRSRKRENFEFPEKILTQHVSGGIKAFFDENKRYYMQTINGTIINNKNFNSRYVLAALNSKLIGFYYDNVFNIGAEFTTAVAIHNLDLIPIKNISLVNQQPFIEKANLMQSLNKELKKISDSFVQLLQSKFNIETKSKKIQNWHILEFGNFLKEFEKARKKSFKENETEYIELSLNEEDKWMQYFNEQKQKTTELKIEIDKTDKEIDQMIYELYCLTNEEIDIVENN